MSYGILVAVDENDYFQIVGEVDSYEEAAEMANQYTRVGPDAGWLAPFEFHIHRRGHDGAYTTTENLSWCDALEEA